MSDNTYQDDGQRKDNLEQDEYIDFVQPVNENVNTDSILDIKSGIFNLFNSLYSHTSAIHGPILGLRMSLDYLNSIILHFQKVLEESDINNK